jgi:hypothetical protein
MEPTPRATEAQHQGIEPTRREAERTLRGGEPTVREAERPVRQSEAIPCAGRSKTARGRANSTRGSGNGTTGRANGTRGSRQNRARESQRYDRECQRYDGECQQYERESQRHAGPSQRNAFTPLLPWRLRVLAIPLSLMPPRRVIASAPGRRTCDRPTPRASREGAPPCRAPRGRRTRRWLLRRRRSAAPFAGR